MRGSRCDGLRWARRCAAACALAAAVAMAPAAPPVGNLPEMLDREAVQAVEKGLTYLARTQRADGSWLSNGASGEYPAAMTALASVSMLSGGFSKS